MAMTESRLDRNGLPPITDEAVAAVDDLVDTAFWWLLLEENLDIAERNVEFLVSALRLRMGQVRVWAREEASGGR